MTPPEGLPPLPPNTYYGGQLKDHLGHISGYCFETGAAGWTHYVDDWEGLKDNPSCPTADWHIALPLPDEDAIHECEQCGEEISPDGDGHNSRCYRLGMPPSDLEEDAKTEGETPKITARLLKAIRGLTADVPHRAFDPDWFIIGEEIKEIETSLSSARAEVEKYASELQTLCDTIMGAPNVATRFSDVRQRLLDDMTELTTIREENRRLREWQPISTAPKDGTKMDLWGKDRSHWGKGPNTLKRWPDCYWLNDGGFSKWTNRYGDSVDATHWRPIPAAPESKGGGEGLA